MQNIIIIMPSNFLVLTVLQWPASILLCCQSFTIECMKCWYLEALVVLVQ